MSDPPIQNLSISQDEKKPEKKKFNFSAASFTPSWMPSAQPFVPTGVFNANTTAQSDEKPKASASAAGDKAKVMSLGSNKPATPSAPPKEASPEQTPAPEVEAKRAEIESTPEPLDDEVSEEEQEDLGKEHLNIIFIGHVDAGKSTMGGHILFLTGMVDKRTMEKYEKEAKEAGRESWYLSWALDLNAEERAKGKTTEYGRGYFETEKRKFTIIDAPGHKNFVPSMIGGAAQADVGVLVISARKGEFETGFERGGQTREHAVLAKTAGVKKLIMVINKMDDPTVAWSKERYDECVSKILPFLKGVGYDPKKDLDILPVSGFSGANLKDRLSKDVCDWYEGPSLLELLDNLPLARTYNGTLLMPIADKFKDMGTVVIGKVESGKVKKGQKIMVMPNKRIAEVLAIYMEESEITLAKAGDNIRMRLKNVEEEDVMRGFVICSRKSPVHTVRAFEAQLKIVEYKSIICAGYSAVMHAHTLVEENLLHMIDKKTGKKSKHPPKFVKQGDACIVRLECNQAVCLESYDEYQQLGRFTLRDEGNTVAIGKVTKLIFD